MAKRVYQVWKGSNNFFSLWKTHIWTGRSVFGCHGVPDCYSRCNILRLCCWETFAQFSGVQQWLCNSCGDNCVYSLCSGVALAYIC